MYLADCYVGERVLGDVFAFRAFGLLRGKKKNKEPDVDSLLCRVRYIF